MSYEVLREIQSSSSGGEISSHAGIGEILAQILPLLMMRQQRIPRAHWQHFQTDRGKRWIERVRD